MGDRQEVLAEDLPLRKAVNGANFASFWDNLRQDRLRSCLEPLQCVWREAWSLWSEIAAVAPENIRRSEGRALVRVVLAKAVTSARYGPVEDAEEEIRLALGIFGISSTHELHHLLVLGDVGSERLTLEGKHGCFATVQLILIYKIMAELSARRGRPLQAANELLVLCNYLKGKVEREKGRERRMAVKVPGHSDGEESSSSIVGTVEELYYRLAVLECASHFAAATELEAAHQVLTSHSESSDPLIDPSHLEDRTTGSGATGRSLLLKSFTANADSYTEETDAPNQDDSVSKVSAGVSDLISEMKATEASAEHLRNGELVKALTRLYMLFAQFLPVALVGDPNNSQCFPEPLLAGSMPRHHFASAGLAFTNACVLHTLLRHHGRCTSLLKQLVYSKHPLDTVLANRAFPHV